MVDWGGTTDRIDFSDTYTSIYYNNPLRYRNNLGNIILENDDQRYKNEIY